MDEKLLNSAELHDAEIISIAVSRFDEVAKIYFQKIDGNVYLMELRGLKSFRCEDLVLQNVVSRVLQASKKQFSSENLEWWLDWVTSLSDTDSWLNNERRHEWRVACETGHLDLVVVEPSGGAQVAAVCEQVVLS